MAWRLRKKSVVGVRRGFAVVNCKLLFLFLFVKLLLETNCPRLISRFKESTEIIRKTFGVDGVVKPCFYRSSPTASDLLAFSSRSKTHNNYNNSCSPGRKIIEFFFNPLNEQTLGARRGFLLLRHTRHVVYHAGKNIYVLIRSFNFGRLKTKRHWRPAA